MNIITPTILSKKIINKYFDLNKTIINISSGAANKSIPSWSTYCATKSALDRFTDTISKEDIPNLNVYSVHPGVVDTDMQKNIRESKQEHFPLKEKFVEYYEKNQLENPQIVAQKIYLIIKNPSNFCKNIVFVRNIELN